MTDIERQGREAALAGRRHTDCPHPHGQKRKDWLKGYDRTIRSLCNG